MIWAKRRFSSDIDPLPYMERLAGLREKTKPASTEFIMVARNARSVGDYDVYVGVPTRGLLVDFDGFEEIPENSLPGEIDVPLYALNDEVEKRFTIRDPRELLRARREESSARRK
jgi:hypothetical protein